MKTIKHATTAVCLTSMLWAGLAQADGWPASVAGNWTVQGNQSAGVLSIAQFAGAAGSQCKPIRGTIYGADAIEGFYCPHSGRISFLRKIGTSTTTKQTWAGNVSQLVAGYPLWIGGTFHALPHNNVGGTTGGSLGEYNFHARK